MGMKNAKLPAGFTFSFPCEQTAINTVSVKSESLQFKKDQHLFTVFLDSDYTINDDDHDKFCYYKCNLSGREHW